MSTRPVPWSWLALALSVLPLGGVMALGLGVSDLFRDGQHMDPDSGVADYPFLAILSGMAEVGLVGALFLVVAWWLTRRAASPERAFAIFAVGIPTGILSALKLSAISGPGLFKELAYPPTWLELVAFALAFLAGALTYIRISRAAAAFRSAR